MQKKAMLALLIAAVLMFSGCALVVTDPVADNAQVILSVNGETMDKGTVAQLVNSTIEQNNYMNQFYMQMMGQSAGYDTNPRTVLSTVLDANAMHMVETQKARELGFDKLSEEDTALVKEAANQEYENFLTQIETQYLKDSEKTGDELRKEAEEYAEKNGFSVDMEAVEKEMMMQKAVENLHKDIVKDVTVDDSELEALLNEKVEAEKADYETTLSNFGYTANNGEDYYYVPAGYRMVKQVLVKFTEEDEKILNDLNTALNTANSELTAANTAVTDAKAAVETPAEGADMEALKKAVTDAEAAAAEKQTAKDQAQAAYDAAKETAYANVADKANEVIEKARAGEDFDALIKEYNQDPGMTDENGNVKAGYAVCADYPYFDKAFMDAAMSLEKVGDVAEPAKGAYGFYIIRYDADLTEGAKTVEEMRGPLTQEKLTEKQNAHYEAVSAQWLSEADVKMNPEKMGF